MGCNRFAPWRVDFAGRSIREETMRNPQPSKPGPNSEKPARREGPVGLLFYGLLTILGGLALVLVAE
jgi:hypothetical protein